MFRIRCFALSSSNVKWVASVWVVWRNDEHFGLLIFWTFTVVDNLNSRTDQLPNTNTSLKMYWKRFVTKCPGERYNQSILFDKQFSTYKTQHWLTYWVAFISPVKRQILTYPGQLWCVMSMGCGFHILSPTLGPLHFQVLLCLKLTCWSDIYIYIHIYIHTYIHIFSSIFEYILSFYK